MLESIIYFSSSLNFKDWIWALAEQICTIKTSDRSQINPKKILYKTAFLAQLPCLARHSL